MNIPTDHSLKSMLGYLYAIIAILLATFFHFLLNPIVGDNHPFITYLFAVIIVAWRIGTAQAIVALISGAVLAAICFLPPLGSLLVHNVDSQVQLAIYVIIGSMIIALTSNIHKANARATDSARIATEKNAELLEEIEKRKSLHDANTFLMRRLVSVQEEERKRISRELHDQCEQDLAALHLVLRLLTDALPDEHSERIQQPLSDIRTILERLSADVHNIAFELRPPSLDEMGLRSAVESYLSIYKTRFGIDVDFQCRSDSTVSVPESVETALYRVIQESLTNVAKHARTKSVTVVLEITREVVSAIVEDQGVGFAPELKDSLATNEIHLGIMGMRERLDAVGGSLKIEAEPGGGTTIFAKVPTQPDWVHK